MAITGGIQSTGALDLVLQIICPTIPPILARSRMDLRDSGGQRQMRSTPSSDSSASLKLLG